MTDRFLLTEQEKTELAALRRELHREPEIGNREFETTKRLAAALSALGLEVLRPLPTGCVGVLRGGKPGETVALRADIDALPVREKTGCAFASATDGVMHACGHDVHAAALIGAAKLLVRRQEQLSGSVLFVFQPNEEEDGGAERMLASGALDGASAMFGCHVDPALPAGQIGVRYGKFYAAADTFNVTFLGKSCHGATPEKGADALAAAATAIPALKSLPQTVLPERAVVTTGTFRAGTARNIIADRAEITGIIRTLGEDTRALLRERFITAVNDAAAVYGCTAELLLHRGYPGVVNHEAETRFAEETATALFGTERVGRIAEPTMTTEDFGYYLMRMPGSYYHVGAGSPYPLHSPRFLPPEETLFAAARLHAAVAAGWLNRKRPDRKDEK